jgi:putative ABC transport system permease protein
MLSNYLKVAIKVLLRRKFFTFISLFGISVTLMVLMVASAVLDNLFGPGVPESRQSRILGIYWLKLSGPRGSSGGSPGYAFLDRYARDLPGAEETSFFSDGASVISFVDGQKIESNLKRTDGAFWRIFDFRFVEGGPFADEDEQQGNFVAVINETTRRRFFDDGVPAVGREITVDRQTFRVVGVVEDVSLLRRMPFAEVWVPISTSRSSGYRSQLRSGFQAAVLARDRAAFPDLKAEYRSRVAQAELPDPATFDTAESQLETKLEEVSRGMYGAPTSESRPGLLLLTVIVAMLLFMALPTLNLVNLNLSRIMERASEIGVRKSFGASSRSLVGQFVVENIVLTLIGGGVGLLLSLGALDVLNSIDLLPYATFSLNLRVFGYGLVLALVFGLLSGVYPAWRMSRLNPVEALQGRTT